MVIDAGIAFPRGEMLGVDLVLPDLRYLEERADRVRAVILTHGHEDHVGALPYLLRRVEVPEVWATRLTLGMVKSKLDEHGLGSARPIGRSSRRRRPSTSARSRPSSSGSRTRSRTRWRSRSTPARGRSSTPATSRSTTPRSTASVPTSPSWRDRLRGGGRPPRRLDERGGAGLDALRADGRDRPAPDHPRGAGAGHRDELREPHPPPPGGDRRRRGRGRKVAVVGRSMTKNLNIARSLGYATSRTAR